MKRNLILVLFITLASGMSVMAQTTTKKKPRSRRKTTTAKRVTKPVVDTTAKVVAMAPIAPPVKMDTLASVPDSDDGYFKSKVMTNARPFPIYEPNANSVKYYHMYKRDIDLKDRRNAKFITPGATLIEAILQGIKDGVITPYSSDASKANPTGDEFTVPITLAQVMAKLQDTVMVNRTDSNGNALAAVRKINDFSPSKIVGYRIKEDVYYDKQRAKVETRIVGIAPLYVFRLTNGDSAGVYQTCWLKYKDCRKVFAKMDVSDPDKNLYDVSMDDMFLQRQFNGQIVYESNPKEEWIKEYEKTPEDQLKEANRIEKKLADYKKNIWKYQTTMTAISVPDKPDKVKKTKTTTTASTDTTSGNPVKP